MRYIKIEVPVSNRELDFLKKLADHDGFTLEQELVSLARLQLIEEMEHKEGETWQEGT